MTRKGEMGYTAQYLFRELKKEAKRILAAPVPVIQPGPLRGELVSEIETGPTVDFCNLPLVGLAERIWERVTISKQGRGTHIRCLAEEGGESSLRLSRFILPYVLMRYLNMVKVERSEDLQVEGVIPILWKGVEYPVHVRFKPDKEGVTIVLSLSLSLASLKEPPILSPV